MINKNNQFLSNLFQSYFFLPQQQYIQTSLLTSLQMPTNLPITIVCVLSLLILANSYTCPVPDPGDIKLGSSAVVCISFDFIDSSDVTTTKTYAFKTTVDKFSALKISGLAVDLAANDKIVKAILQFQNSDSSFEMVLSDSTASIYREIFSFVVGIQEGKYTEITLDNAGCDVCDTADNQVCSTANNNECFEKGESYQGQDPIFYISWIGTDIDKNYMLSNTMRLSRFYQYSIGSIYQKAKSLIKKML